MNYLLETDDTFRELLGIKKSDKFNLVGWIADTSLEYDHERFNGYLKVSVEELYIALRDEAGMLVELVELIDEDNRVGSLYLDGFRATSFVEVIEHSKIWGH